MNTPKKSRNRVMDMIKNSDEHVTMKDVIDLENREHLYFGPNVDAVDFILSQKVIGSINIDEQGNVT